MVTLDIGSILALGILLQGIGYRSLHDLANRDAVLRGCDLEGLAGLRLHVDRQGDKPLTRRRHVTGLGHGCYSRQQHPTLSSANMLACHLMRRYTMSRQHANMWA